jgi:hypothetical protein
LKVEKNEIGLILADSLKRFLSVCGLADHEDIREERQFFAQDFSRDWLVVCNYGPDHSCSFSQHRPQ